MFQLLLTKYFVEAVSFIFILFNRQSLVGFRLKEKILQIIKLI